MGHTHLYYSFVFYSHINPIMGTETLWENNCHVQYEVESHSGKFELLVSDDLSLYYNSFLPVKHNSTYWLFLNNGGRCSNGLALM